jgi:hypothetical protein
LSRSSAVVTPAPPPELELELELELPPEAELLLEPLPEPQAVTARPSASVAMSAGTPRVWVIDLSSEM